MTSLALRRRAFGSAAAPALSFSDGISGGRCGFTPAAAATIVGGEISISSSSYIIVFSFPNTFQKMGAVISPEALPLSPFA